METVVLVFLALVFLAVEPVRASQDEGQRNRLIWIQEDTVKLVHLDDPFEPACELGKYPDGIKSPPILTYLENLEVVAACGGMKDRMLSLSCYTFNGSSWKPMERLEVRHCPSLVSTKNFYTENGWWVAGQLSNNHGACISVYGNELLTPSGQWSALPMSSPYGDIFPGGVCGAALNSTHILISGGQLNGVKADCFIYNIMTGEWTATTPMSKRRSGHACSLTEGGEVIVVKGEDNFETVNHVEIYNPQTQEWRSGPQLPGAVYDSTVVLLPWSKGTILLTYSGHIWILDGEEWIYSDLYMGTTFSHSQDPVVMVPDQFVSCK